MKVSSVVLVTLAAADKDKKVPPRTPAQRLNRLQIFSAEWLNDNLPSLPSRENWISKFEINAERMMDAFQRPHCGFFDPSLPFGGPDANPELRPNLTPRRTTDDRKRRSDGGDESFTDEFGELLRYNKNEPLVGIKQITTGYRKWAERYINECWGQRKHNYQRSRMNKWFKVLGDHYVATQEA
jgi:hypothetical protein